MDTNLLGEDVHNVNILTVIASESYDSFAKGLQSELAEAVADRPRTVTADLFKGKVIKDNTGAEQVIDIEMAQAIYEGLIVNGYVKKGALTDKFYEDKKTTQSKWQMKSRTAPRMSLQSLILSMTPVPLK